MKRLDLDLKSIEQQRDKAYVRMAKRMARAAPQVAAAPKICTASARGNYSGLELSAPAIRGGADDSLLLPSRVGNTLHFRDGREMAI